MRERFTLLFADDTASFGKFMWFRLKWPLFISLWLLFFGTLAVVPPVVALAIAMTFLSIILAARVWRERRRHREIIAVLGELLQRDPDIVFRCIDRPPKELEPGTAAYAKWWYSKVREEGWVDGTRETLEIAATPGWMDAILEARGELSEKRVSWDDLKKQPR